MKPSEMRAEIERLTKLTQRQRDMIVALRELVANFEGRMMPDAKGQ